jgi:hypothetical protein
MVNSTGKVFKYINALNAAGIFGDLVKVGSRLYGTGTLTEIDGETAGNVAYREIADPYLERNWNGITLEPIYYDGNSSFILENDEVIISVNDPTVLSPPYQSRLYRYKDFRFDITNTWLTPEWEEVGSSGNRPPFGNVKEIAIRNNIIYIQGTYHTPAKFESGIWSILPSIPSGSAGISDTLEVDSLDQVIVATYENLWRLESGVWINLLNVLGYHINARVTSSDNIFAHLRENIGANSEFRYYNGVSWASITNPVNIDFTDAVTDRCKFIIYNDELYAVGLNIINSSYNVFKWDGSTWLQIGNIQNDIPDVVGWENFYALHVDDKGIYLNTINTSVGSFIIKWNGSNWIKIANSLESDWDPYGSIFKFLRKSNGRLMGVGYFSSIEGIPAKSISRFDIDE